MLAFYLLGVGALLFLSPGLAFLIRMRVPMEWPVPLLYAFAISYSWIFGLSIVLPVAGWTVDHAAVLTLLLVLALLPWRQLPDGIRALRPSPALTWLTGVVLAIIVLVYASSAWFIEPILHGDAALDLVSMARFADGGAIRLDNTSILPNTRAAYLFQPYQLALGTIARWSHTDPIVAFQKIRPLLVLLSLTFVYVTLRRLVPARAHAQAAFAVVLVFVGLDMTTWEDKSLFPVVHRGGMAAGLCVPVLMVLALAATRRLDHVGDSERRLATYLTPVFLLASICTHALEMYTLLCFVGAVGLAVLTGLDRAGDRRQVVKLGALVALALALYLPARAYALPDFTAYERDLKVQLQAEFSSQHSTVPDMLAGSMGQEAGDLLGGRIPATTAGIIGIPALALAVLLAPASAAVLALAIVPLAVMYASPLGYLVLALATSADSAQETTAYFALVGLLALSIGIAAVAQLVLGLIIRPRSILLRGAALALLALGLLWLWPTWHSLGVAPLLAFVRSRPQLFVLTAALLAVPLLVVATRRRTDVVPASPLAPAAVIIAALIALPLAGEGLPPTERISLVSALQTASTVPSVLDWNAYYEVLRTTMLPRLPVPRPVVDDLRSRVPPRQVLLADPRYSCSLAVVVNAYCVNPEFIYGQYFLAASPYQARYVHSIEGVDADWHPFFNTTWPMEDRERTFLREYAVDYLLAGPEHAALIDQKLVALDVAAVREFSRDGYVLYKFDSRGQ